MALIYIDRLIQRNNFLLTELNVHRVVITAILLAAKFFDDAYYNNAYYAKVGGVLVSEMNGLEVDFLFRINFSLHVTPDLFHKYRAELASHSVSAGVFIPPSSPMHSIRTTHHTDAGIMGGGTSLSRRTESARPMQTDQTIDKRNVVTGAFITPSPPSSSARASAFPSDYSSNGSSNANSAMSGDFYPHYYEHSEMNANGSALVHTIHGYPTSGVPSGMDTDDQFVVAGNFTYPMDSIHHHHQPTHETGSLGKLMEHYHASAASAYHGHAQSEPGYGNIGAHDAPVAGATQHYVGGRNMLTGVSSGM